ncbi:MAG: PAS domain-containing sensor histidine kinase [Pseudomonadota bacterium]|nr:PAS domain-containing sensor histidine kinase [Pseudomonadota bacterium]
MVKRDRANFLRESGEKEVTKFRLEMGPFVVAADDTRMPMIFVDANSELSEIVYTNQSFLETMGYERAELLGWPFDTILAPQPGSDRFVLTETLARERSSHQVRCRRKDRTEFEAALLVSPVFGVKGELRQFFLSVVDLTAQLESRDEEHARFRDLFRNAPGFIGLTTGPDHRFTYANKAFATLVGQADLRGQKVADVLPEIAGQGFLNLLNQVYESGQHFTGKRVPITVERTHGPEVRYLDFVYQPIRDQSGKVAGLFCEGTDVTELQESYLELEVVQARLVHLSRLNAMGTMAATLAHELNQPLAAIANYAAGCATLVTEEGASGGSLHEGLKGIALAADRAGSIIRRLRSLTTRTTQTQAFDAAQTLEEAVQLVRAGGCEEVLITVKYPASGRIQGDRVQIQQVLINLLKNACEAARESAEEKLVSAGSFTKRGHVTFYVEDSGLGISNDDQAKLFHWADSNKPDGMGIGLSISRTIVERHHGTISLDRTGSSGTRFSFTLPEAEPDSEKQLPPVVIGPTQP